MFVAEAGSTSSAIENETTTAGSTAQVESFASHSVNEKTPEDPTSDLSSLLPMPQGIDLRRL